MEGRLIEGREPALCSLVCWLQICITVAMLFSSPIFQSAPSEMQLWPLVPLFANRLMEIGYFLLGKAPAMVCTTPSIERLFRQVHRTRFNVTEP